MNTITLHHTKGEARGQAGFIETSKGSNTTTDLCRDFKHVKRLVQIWLASAWGGVALLTLSALALQLLQIGG